MSDRGGRESKIMVLYFSSQYAKDMDYEGFKDCGRDKIMLGNLPSENLVVQPGVYSLWSGGGAICLEKEGLYRIMDRKNMRSFQVIVFKNEVWELVNAVAKLFLYGNSDDNLRLHEWTKIAVQRHILQQCGPCASSVFRLLQSLGVKARVVGLKEKDGSGGHVINEVFIEGKWVLIDFINKKFFVNEMGHKVSLLNVVRDGGFHRIALQDFSGAENFSNNSGKVGEISVWGSFFNGSFMIDFLRYDDNLKRFLFDKFKMFMNSEEPVKKMYYICDNGCEFHCESFVDGYYVPLSTKEFISKFYGD